MNKGQKASNKLKGGKKTITNTDDFTHNPRMFHELASQLSGSFGAIFFVLRWVWSVFWEKNEIIE